MLTVDDLIKGFTLAPLGDGRFSAPNVDYYGSAGGDGAASAVADVIAGGQLLGQAIAAAGEVHPGKEAKTVHLIFARSGKVSEPLEVVADNTHEGRSFGCVAIRFEQGGRAICQGTVLTHVPDPDFIRHADELPARPGPDSGSVRIEDRGCYEVGILPGADDSLPDVGPASLPMWVRFPGAPANPIIGQALTAFATNFFLIGTAMRPHAGLSPNQSHLAMSTGVLSHTITFHEAIRAGEWLAIEQESPYAGSGRTYGRGDVFDQEGRLLASYVQDGMIRAFGPAGSSGHKGSGATL